MKVHSAIARLLRLPELDGWTAVLLRTYLQGDIDGIGVVLLVRAQADRVAASVALEADAGRVTFAELAEACILDAVHAELMGAAARAERSAGHALVHLDGVELVYDARRLALD